jgi:hypothetical protein
MDVIMGTLISELGTWDGNDRNNQYYNTKTNEWTGTDESIQTNKKVFNKSGVPLVLMVPDECQSLIQTLEKVEWEKVYMQEVEGRCIVF